MKRFYVFIVSALSLASVVQAQVIDVFNNGIKCRSYPCKGKNKYKVVIREEEPSKDHEVVDLGLSVKWATCNVGASTPHEGGDYFAWGEIEPKNYYSWESYKWGSYKSLTKYCTYKYYGYKGFTDGKTVLEPEDDAATANWGAGYRMPTSGEISELVTKCIWSWDSSNKGYIVTGLNGCTIFIPASGRRVGLESLYDYGTKGLYWSNTLDDGLVNGAHHLGFDTSYYAAQSGGYCCEEGHSVRPVAESVQIIDVYNNGSLVISYVNSGGNSYKVVVREDAAEDKHEMVDLGLSVKWAACNVGASTPFEDGDYFAWGETEQKPDYNWSSYKWCNCADSTLTKYCANSPYGYNGFTDGKTVLDSEDDAATANWGAGYRIPTFHDFYELLANCTCIWDFIHKGYIIKASNGNSIFLPASGYRKGHTYYQVGCVGKYACSVVASEYPEFMYNLIFDSEIGIGHEGNWKNRCFGFPVRPVSDN